MAQLQVNKRHRVSRVAARARTTVGRSSQNDLVLAHRSVSRRHCVIEVIDGQAWLRDLGSRYGTRVNGEHVHEKAPLADGDVIQVGPFEIAYSDTDADPADAPATSETGTPDIAEDSAAGSAAGETPPAGTEAPAPAQPTQESGLLKVEIERLKDQLHEERRRRQELDAQLTAARGEAQEQRQHAGSLEGRLVRLQAEAEAEKRHASVLEQELADVRTQAREQTQEQQALRNDLHKRIEEGESTLEAMRQRAQRTERTLETRARQLDKANAAIAALKQRLQSAEDAQRLATRRAEAAERSVIQLEAARQPLLDVSQRLASIQRTLRALEALWLETNQWVDEAENGDPDVIAQAVQQRDSVSEKLEAAHVERDRVLGELQELVGHFSRAATTEYAERNHVAERSWIKRVLS